VVAQGAAHRSNGLYRQRYESDMMKRGLTLDNALNITSRISINDAGLEAGCTIAPAKLASGKPLS
jgi:hypothetical protein